MSGTQQAAPRASFGEFTLDLDACELRKNGTSVPLSEQPLRLLEVLVEKPGVLVSRDELRDRLWAADTFVDFEHGLNAAVKRLRDALGDSADYPRYIETVPKRGYRFIASVDRLMAPGPAVGPVSLITRQSTLLAVGIAAAVIITAGLAWSLLADRIARGSISDAPRRLRRITFDGGQQTDPTFSPDSKYIAYASNKTGNFDIWMQPLDGGPVTQLTHDPANDTQPDWSPDGRSILFRSERDGGGLFVVSPADKHIVRLTSKGYRPRWSPDGSMFAFGGGLFYDATSYVARADGTNITPVVRDSVGMAGYGIGWHAAGKLAFFYGGGPNIALKTVAPPRWEATTAEIAPQVRRQFENLLLSVVDRQRLAWSHDGRTMYFVGEANGSRGIWSVTVGGAYLHVTSGPVRVTTGLGSELTPASDRSGRMLAFSTSTATARVWLLDLDATGRLDGHARPVTASELDSVQPVLSRDGRRLVVLVQRPGGGSGGELREISIDDGVERTLRTFNETTDRLEWVMMPRLSPDGTQLLYSYRDVSKNGIRSAIRRLDLISLVESPVTSLRSDDTFYVDNPWGWSADGRSILATGSRYRAGFFNLVRLPLAAAPESEKAAQILVSSKDLRFWQADESRDGRWVCFNGTTGASDNSGIYVVAATGGEPRRLSDANSWDDKPRWSSDGRSIYFLSVRGGDLNVWAIGFDRVIGKATGVPVQITRYSGPDGSIGSADRIEPADISIAGSRMVVPVRHLSGAIWIIE